MPPVYVLDFLGVLASYYATEEKRVEAFSGRRSWPRGWRLFLRKPAAP